MKTCSKCTVPKDELEFNKKNGKPRSWCKECEKEYELAHRAQINYSRRMRRTLNAKKYVDERDTYYLANRERILERNAKWRHSFEGKLFEYKRGARNRNIEWALTDEEFKSFWQKSCFYCGDVVESIGLDRINPKGTYHTSNLVSCCTTCNYMKTDLTYQEFTSHLIKILKQLNLCKEE